MKITAVPNSTTLNFILFDNCQPYVKSFVVIALAVTWVQVFVLDKDSSTIDEQKRFFIHVELFKLFKKIFDPYRV